MESAETATAADTAEVAFDTKPAGKPAVERSANETAALERVRRYMAWSAAAGLLPLPGLDMAAIFASQLKMLSEIAGIYHIPFKRAIVKEALSGLLGSFLPVSIAQGASSAMKALPLIGPLASVILQPGLAAASTWAVGKVFIQHFESGGTFLDFDPDAVKEYFKEQYEAAKSGLTGKSKESGAAKT